MTAHSAAFFAHPALTALIASTPEIELPPGTLLFEFDEPCASLPFVVSGCADVRTRDENGRYISLYRLQHGEICPVSLAALLRNGPYPAQAVVEQRLHVRLLPGEHLKKQIESSPEIFQLFLKSVTARLDSSIAEVRQIIIEPDDVRLARLLKSLFIDAPHPVLEITPDELAAKLGASRENTSRLLKKLEHANCIRLSNSHVALRDAGNLKALIDTGSVLS